MLVCDVVKGESTSGRRYEVKMKGEDGRGIPRRKNRVGRSLESQAMMLNMKKRPPWNLIDGSGSPDKAMPQYGCKRPYSIWKRTAVKQTNH